jgi:hypothetical protein
VICGGGLALPIARAYVAAGAGVGVELTDVAGDATLPPLDTEAAVVTAGIATLMTGVTFGTLGTLIIPTLLEGGAMGICGFRPTSLSERNSSSLRPIMLTPVAASSRTVGWPSMTVTMCLMRLSWNSSSRNGA